jgi:small basic protein (TIGR04137 family)
MSMDPSLKAANALIRHRNVLTRAERLEKLKDEEKWNEEKSVFGLPKVGHRKAVVAAKVKEAAAEGATPGGTATPAGPVTGGAKTAAAPAAKTAGKAAAPAAKAAAPAAKKK